LTLLKTRYPAKIGCEGSGIVVAVGPEVKSFSVGDAVYGLYIPRPMFLVEDPGFCSEYAMSEETFLLPKPAHMSFEEAAAITGSALTAYQCVKRGFQLSGGVESLEGKTVFVSGALSSTGSAGIQLLKNVYGAKKVISTVSTSKIPLVKERMPGMVDEIIDYKTQRVRDVVPRGSVDYAYSTQWTALNDSFGVVDPKAGVVMSIASIPKSDVVKGIFGDSFPAWLGWLLDFFQLWYRWKLRGTNIKYEFVSGNPAIREDMEKVGEFVASGKLKPVITVIPLDDIDAIRRHCENVRTSRGGVGKLVIKVV
jgi:NADPH:quinone reductase-like Zn-dependent oxidoreductase